MQPLAVTRGTIAATVIADGFWSREQVCTGLERECARQGITLAGRAG